jgi:multiple sugar transport system substrate-binding protein
MDRRPVAVTRRAVIRYAAILGTLATAACTGVTPGARPDVRPAGLQGPATINILYGGGGQPVLDLYNCTAFASFQQRFPGSTINLDSSGNPLSKVLTLHAAGSAPDIIQGADTWVIDVAKLGLAVALDSRVRQWEARTDFHPSAWEAGHEGGKQWGVPLFVTARMVYLRKAVLDEVGITKTPQSWEELLHTAERSTRVEGGQLIRQGFTSPAGDGWWYFFWLLQTTGATLFKGGKPAFTGEEGEITLQFMKDLQSAIRPSGIEPLPENEAAGFTAGRVAHAWLHLAPYQAIQQQNLKDYHEMIISVPQVPGNTRYRLPGGRTAQPLTFVDNALLFLSSQSKYPDHAWELMKLLLEGETLLEFNRLRGRLVPRKSLWKQGYMQEEKLQQIVAVYERYGRPRFNPPNFDAVTQAINATVTDVVRDQKVSVRDGLAALARELERIAQDAKYSGDTRT